MERWLSRPSVGLRTSPGPCLTNLLAGPSYGWTATRTTDPFLRRATPDQALGHPSK